MKARLIFGLFLAILLVAGCATAEEHPAQSANTPSAQQLQDAAGTPAPAAPQPQLSQIDPASLDVSVVAWGASLLGKSSQRPAGYLLAPETALETSTVKDLPQDVRAALEAARKADGKAYLLLLYGGVQPSPAYGLAVDSISVQGDVLKVTWSLKTPTPNTGGSDVQAYPYAILALRGVDLDLVKGVLTYQ